jgi:hypothetical protein
MIDDLAIAYDRISSVSAGDGLASMLDIDDAEAPHAETEVAVD